MANNYNKETNNKQATIDSSFNNFFSKFKPIRREVVRGSGLSIREKETLSRAIFGILLGESEEKWLNKTPPLNALISSPLWDKIKEVVSDNEILAGYATYYILKYINDALANPQSDLNQLLSEIMKEIEKLFGRKISEDSLLQLLYTVKPNRLLEILGPVKEDLNRLEQFRSRLNDAKKKLGEIMDNFIFQLIEELKQLSETLSILSALIPGRYWDLSPGIIKSVYFRNLLLLAGIMKRIDNLRELVEILGRLELSVRRENKLAPAVSNEIYEVMLSGDIERVIPSELVKLRHKKLKLLFYAKMFERGLLTYYLRGKMPYEERKGDKRGPIIIAIDTSGSMHGMPELLSRAIALAVIFLASKQRRKVYLILFSGPNDLEELEFKAGKTSLERLLKFLSISFGGGTDFNTPIRRVISLLNKKDYDKADVLFLTDGLSQIDHYTLKELIETKSKRNARIFTIIVGNNNLGGAKEFSDEAFYIIRGNLGSAPRLIKNLINAL